MSSLKMIKISHTVFSEGSNKKITAENERQEQKHVGTKMVSRIKNS